MPDSFDSLRSSIQDDPSKIFENINALIELNNESDKNINSFEESIKNGLSPVIYSNHQSHADGVIFSLITDRIIHDVSYELLKGFFLPVAYSMQSGHQDESVKSGGNLFFPMLYKRGVMTIPVIREDDRVKYGITGSNEEALKKILLAPREKCGLAIFPEGTVKGGRTKKGEKIFGMQKADQAGFILRCLGFWESIGKKGVLLPIGIIGSYKLFNPDSYEIQKELMPMLLGVAKAEKIVKVVIGNPFTSEEIKNDLRTQPDPKNTDHINYLMKKISILIPSEMRGYYF